MFMSVLLILTFQMFHGHIYHQIGLLTAVFMLGAAFGSYAAMRYELGLVAMELCILAHAVCLYGFLAWAPENSMLSQASIYVLMLLCGVLTGTQFPAVMRYWADAKQESPVTAGRYYAMDLLGAFFGAVVTAVAMLPILGLQQSLIAVMAVKTGSLILLVIGQRDTAAA